MSTAASKSPASTDEHLFHNIFEHAAVGIAQVALDGTMLRLNPRFCDIVGYSEAELLALTFQDITHTDDLDLDLTNVETLLQGQAQTYSMEKRYIRKDGESVWVSLTVSLVRDDQQPQYFIAVVEDISDRKQTEAQAKRQRIELTLLETILDIILAGYWDWDIPNNREYLSPGFKRMFGYDDHELPNTPETWQTLIFPEDLQAVLDCFDRHVSSQGQVPYVNEVRYRHKDGSTVWVICSGQVIEWDEANKPLRMIGCHIDITQRKQAEIQLRQTKDELEQFFAVTLDLLCIADIDGNFRRLNTAWATTLGYDISDLEGNCFLDLVHPDDVAPTLQAIATLNSKETIRAFVNRYRCKDGTYRYIEWYSRPQGNLIYAAARDITERKQVEERLRKSEAHLRTAQRIGKIGSWEFTIATGEISWSDEVFHIFGRDSGLGPPSYEELQQLYHPDDQAHHDHKVQCAIQQAEPFEVECRAYRPNGSIVYIQARGEPIVDTNGHVVQLIGTVLDITDRKQAEFKILQTSAQLEASNRELEAFAYSVSHDLRSPLRAIDGFSRALLEDYGDVVDEDGQDYFERIRRNVNRMGTLIDDLLKLSRVSRSEMNCTPVNLSQIIQEYIRDLSEMEPHRQVEWGVEPDVIVEADLALMRVVCSNLLQNAWKFTSHHATARIEFGTCRCDHHPHEQSVYFIRDDGAGFDMAYSSMLFGVFQRLHNTNEFPGTGIGLATVQRAIHRHGGTVWAEAAIEQGATIYFTLPQFSAKP